MTGLIYEHGSVTLYLVANEKGLCGVWHEQTKLRAGATFTRELKEKTPATKILKETKKQLDEYFAGQRQTFEIPLDMRGTDFQKKVWAELAKIPFGETLSYRDIAKKIKNEKAVRAVGTANGRNPVSILVPCHRVIQANGTLGGYAGGLSLKEFLLDLEKTGRI